MILALIRRRWRNYLRPDLRAMIHPLSDHCDGHKFHNPGGERAPGLGEVLWWQLGKLLRGREEGPPRPEREDLGETAGEAGVTFLGHASFEVRGSGWRALIDPVFSDEIGPIRGLGYRRFEAVQPKAAGLLEPDFVLVTHNHYDHCDERTLRALARGSAGPVAVAPLGNCKLLKGMGFSKVIELDWWESWRGPGGPVVTLTPAVHFSSRGLFDRNRSLWGGFHLSDGPASFFAAGDTAYGSHFAEVSRRLGAPRLALLPIGAHEPQRLMRGIHQGPLEALQAHADLGAARSAAYHHGAFGLADDTPHGPAVELAELRKARGLERSRFVIPRPGQWIPIG